MAWPTLQADFEEAVAQGSLNSKSRAFAALFLTILRGAGADTG